MQPIQPLLKLWRKWFNRHKLFKADEMNELESHLLDEIDYIKVHDGLSEEEAFQKAVQLIGQRETLDKEYDKNHGFTLPRFVFWFRNHTLQLFIASLLIIIFLVADFQFSQTYTNCTKIQTDFNMPVYMDPVLSLDKGINEEFSFLVYYSDSSYTMSQFITIKWIINQNSVDESIPIFFSFVQYFSKKYILVMDNKKQLWLEDSYIFTPNSRRIILHTNTDWYAERNNIKTELRKAQNHPFPSYNPYPLSSFYLDKSSIRFYSKNWFSSNRLLSYYASSYLLDNSLDLNDCSIGLNNSVLNNCLFVQSDQPYFQLLNIQFFEAEVKNYFVPGIKRTIFPCLFIRSYQFSRKSEGILKFMFNKIKKKMSK